MKPHVFTLAILLFSCALHAQLWRQLNPPVNLFNNIIYATVADNTGKVYAAGGFTDSAGEKAVYVLNNSSWSELGVGAGTLHAKGNIYSLASDPYGNLYAGGAFYDSTGNYYVAKWNGRYWSETAPSTSAQNFTGQIFSLCSDKAGNIYAAGEMIDTLGNYYVSKYDGTQWQPLGTGLQSLRANGIMYSVLADPNGNVYVAGQFTNAAGKWYVAKWNGSSWSELGTGAVALNANGAINSLAIDANGNIYAAGDFKDGSGHQYVAKWDGSTWSSLGNGASALAATEMINTILIDAAGHLFAAGMFSDSTANRIVAEWSGSSWASVIATKGISRFNNNINSLASDPSGNLYVGGNFTNLRGDWYVARDSADNWTQPGFVGGRMPDQSNPMVAMAVDTGGHVFSVLGTTNSAGISVVVRWDGKVWVTLPDTSSMGYASISGLAADSLGNMYACGMFGNLNGIAKWDGTGWSLIPMTSSGITISGISHLATDKIGNVYLSGSIVQNGNHYSLVKWDGSVWTPFANADIINFIVDPTGSMIYANDVDFSNSGYNVLKIEGNTVTNIGITNSQPRQLNATDWILALAMDGSGNLYAAGSIEDSNGNAFVSKWDGTNWTVLGSDTNSFGATGYINAIEFDRNGNLFAGGNLLKHSGTYIGKWNGSSWSTVGDAIEFWAQQDLSFLARDGQGNIYADVSNIVYRYVGNSSSPPPPTVCHDSAQIHLIVNKNTVTAQSNMIEIDAKGIPADGTTFSIEFAMDRDFTNVLSASSGDSVLTLSSASLAIGPNTIFAKMEMLDKCNQTNISIDSITIIKTNAGGIVDQDFPNSPIGAYPNPVIDNVNVSGLSATKSYTIQIYNSRGTNISQVTVSGQTSVNINSLSLQSGVYLLQVYDNTKSKKIGVIMLLKGQ
jgi:hypothetical protein